MLLNTRIPLTYLLGKIKLEIVLVVLYAVTVQILDEAGGEEKTLVADPAVAVHPEGEDKGYVMIYVTQIP